MTDIASLIDMISKGGLLSVLVLALIGGQRGWYVWGGQHRETIKTITDNQVVLIKEKDEQIAEARKDRNYWRNQAEIALSTTERSVGAFEATSSRRRE